VFDRTRKGENALLIQPLKAGVNDPSLLEEFSELARSAGATVVGSVTARVIRPDPSHYIGSGKVDEVKTLCDATGADLILINHALSPIQERNLEKTLGRRVVDRTGLILDIFALRAATHEGKLQVELAQLKHMSTRLVRGWTHLERQRGGAIGLRGPGETQLETDRRLLQKRLEQLQKRLEKVEVQRQQMRRARLRNEIPRVALVGYTNAGKSTLFNALTGAGVLAEDKLFATLDPTVRRLEVTGGKDIVMSDTVGFVRDLPHELVAAFRSTLSEARDADLLLHVTDAADPLRDERIEQVDKVLAEIGASDIPQIRVYNKIDMLDDANPRVDEVGEGPMRVWVSAQKNLGLEALKQSIAARFVDQRLRTTVLLSPSQGRWRARLFELNVVKAEQVDSEGRWHLDVDLPVNLAQRLADQAGGDFFCAPLLVAGFAPTYNSDAPDEHEYNS
jgi:GTPase